MSGLPYKRAVVVGVTSSGKSTLAESLARLLDMTFIELDALYWEPDLQAVHTEIFRARVGKAIQVEKLVIAGNYRIVRDLTWPRAEVIIWLDYPFLTVFWQLTGRTFKRWWTKELLWGTNVESLSTHFKIWSKESLYNWLFQSYWQLKREYAILLSMPEYQHLKVIRFRHPEDTARWLNALDRPDP